jgi:hypothetical protein
MYRRELLSLQEAQKKEEEMSRKNRIQQLFIVFVALGLLVSGCAGAYSTLPREKISEADKAILEAKESNASLNAPIELKAAEDKLAGARAALNNKDYAEATRLAEQALVDADYARAKGTSEKAKKKAEEIRQSIKGLHEEIELLSKQITVQGGK